MENSLRIRNRKVCGRIGCGVRRQEEEDGEKYKHTAIYKAIGWPTASPKYLIRFFFSFYFFTTCLFFILFFFNTKCLESKCTFRLSLEDNLL